MNVIHLNDYVIFRKHLCIGFELMSMNLFEFLKINDFNVSFRLLTTYRALTTTLSADSQSSCSTRSNISKCLRLFTAISSQRTFCSRSQTSRASRSSTLAALHSLMNGFTRTSSPVSTERPRLCQVFHTTVLLICGPSAASWPNSTSDTPFSRVRAKMTRCQGLQKWWAYLKKRCFPSRPARKSSSK